MSSRRSSRNAEIFFHDAARRRDAMRGALRLALCLLGLPQARADDGRRSRLLVAYVAGRDAVSEKRIGP